MNVVNEILWQSIVVFLWLGSVLAFIVGLAMLIRPEKVRHFNRISGRWIDTRRFESALDRPRWTERFVYRHYRLVGAMLFLSSTYVVYKFLIKRAGDMIGPFAANDQFGLWQAATVLFVICGVLGAVIGAIMFAKPSLLREIETASNKWISTEKFQSIFNREHSYFDEAIFVYGRLVSVFLIASSIFVFLRLGRLLLNGYWFF